VVVLPFHLEAGVAQVAPKNRGHPHLVRLLEGLADLHDLARGLWRTEVDRRAHGDSAHIPSLFDLREEDLIVLVGVGEHNCVELEGNGNTVCVLARDRPQDT
jgi:hypothetical protein